MKLRKRGGTVLVQKVKRWTRLRADDHCAYRTEAEGIFWLEVKSGIQLLKDSDESHLKLCTFQVG